MSRIAPHRRKIAPQFTMGVVFCERLAFVCLDVGKARHSMRCGFCAAGMAFCRELLKFSGKFTSENGGK